MGILDVDDIVASQMVLDVDDLSDSADVVTSSDVGKMSGLVFVPFNNGVLFKIEFHGISLVDFRVGETDGSGVVGNDIGNFVGSNSLGFDLEKFEFGFSFFDLGEGESSLDVVEKTIALVGLGDGDDVHNTDGELDVPSELIINLDAGFLVLDDEVCFSAIEGELEVISLLVVVYLRMTERGRHSRSL